MGVKDKAAELELLINTRIPNGIVIRTKKSGLTVKSRIGSKWGEKWGKIFDVNDSRLEIVLDFPKNSITQFEIAQSINLPMLDKKSQTSSLFIQDNDDRDTLYIYLYEDVLDKFDFSEDKFFNLLLKINKLATQ